MLREEFGDLDADVVIVGSWAVRWFGEPGPVPNDVDVLVVGGVEPAVAWDAAARATRRLGIEVNVVVRRDVEWDEDDSRFAQELKHGRRVVIAERTDQRDTGGR